MAESYIRSQNLSVQRFARPIASTTTPPQHGVVNEVAFRIFASNVRLDVPSEGLSTDVVQQCARQAVEHIRRLRQFCCARCNGLMLK